MAIYTNATAVAANRHGIFESSRLKSTFSGGGRIFDALVVEETTGENDQVVRTPINCDNGVAIKIGEMTGNGLSEVYATIAGVGDKIAITGSPAIVKDAYVASQEANYNFFNVAGKDAKAYEIADEDYDVFCIADYQFTSVAGDQLATGQYVVVDGNGGWEAKASASAATYGFIGKIYQLGFDTLNYTTKVYIQAVQNKQIS